MSFRRFLYLVTDDAKSRNFLLRRINMSRFFPKHERDRLQTDPPQLEEGRLPHALMKFDPPTRYSGIGSMNFMLFPGSDSVRDKVIATDFTGCALLYDPESSSLCSLPRLSAPKFAPVCLTVGNNHYILDTNFSLKNNRKHCFDGYFYDNYWRCDSLPPPPYVHHNHPSAYEGIGHVDSYAVVGRNIWLSKPDLGTHCYDTTSGVWNKAGDWVMPFVGHVHYVTEHNLWFGLTYGDSDDDERDGCICASDLTVTPPTAFNIWRDLASPQWTNRSSYLVHLGNSRFCHVRFFEIRRPWSCDVNSSNYVIFSGIEVKEVSGELCVVKHRSEKCRLENRVLHWVL